MTLHLELVDHERHARDVGLRGDQVEERRHRLLGIEQALVHVDVEDLRAVLDLAARDGERGRIVVRLDQLAELGRARDVGPLADIDEGVAAPRLWSSSTEVVIVPRNPSPLCVSNQPIRRSSDSTSADRNSSEMRAMRQLQITHSDFFD